MGCAAHPDTQPKRRVRWKVNHRPRRKWIWTAWNELDAIPGVPHGFKVMKPAPLKGGTTLC
jgi:hypothetical protein